MKEFNSIAILEIREHIIKYNEIIKPKLIQHDIKKTIIGGKYRYYLDTYIQQQP